MFYYERAVAHRHTGRWRVITDRDRSDALRAEDTRNDQKAPEAGTKHGKTFLLSLQKELTGRHLDLDSGLQLEGDTLLLFEVPQVVAFGYGSPGKLLHHPASQAWEDVGPGQGPRGQ